MFYSEHAFVIFLIPFADAALTFPFVLGEQYHLSGSGQGQKVHFNYIWKAAVL
jgi:hypothetical protein